MSLLNNRKVLWARKFILTLLIFSASIASSQAENIATVNLTDGNKSVFFSFPASYKAQAETPSLTEIHCAYPDMTALRKSSAMQDNSIRIFIRISHQHSQTERFVNEALKNFDKNRPGRQYSTGRLGTYELYRKDIGSSTGVLTYVFRAQDGALVGIEDAGARTSFYTVHRSLEHDIHLKYLIAKGLGKDFIEIDNRVTQFIRSHIVN